MIHSVFLKITLQRVRGENKEQLHKTLRLISLFFKSNVIIWIYVDSLLFNWRTLFLFPVYIINKILILSEIRADGHTITIE